MVAVERRIGGQSWAPALEVIDLTPRVARWTGLGGWTTTWAQDADDPPLFEPQATLLLQVHEELRDNLLRLGERRGAHFALGWRAVAGLTGDPPFAGRVPLLVSGEARFTGITVDTSERETDAEVRARLASRIALDGLRALPREVKDHGYDDGVRMAQLRFLPVTPPPGGAG